MRNAATGKTGVKKKQTGRVCYKALDCHVIPSFVLHLTSLTTTSASYNIHLQLSSWNKVSYIPKLSCHDEMAPYLVTNVHQPPPRSLSSPQPNNIKRSSVFTWPERVRRSAGKRSAEWCPCAAAGQHTGCPACRVSALKSVQFARRGAKEGNLFAVCALMVIFYDVV